MGKVITNEQIVKLIAHDNMSLATKMGYDRDTDTVDSKMLSRFGAVPSLANEFLNTMNNVLLNQIVFDVMRGWKSKYTWAQYDVDKYGDIEQFLTAVIGTPDDYDDTDTPFDLNKPTVKEAFMKTELKKVIKRTIGKDTWAGAFTREGGLASLVGIILKNMKDEMDVFMYEYLTAYLEATITKTATLSISAETGAGETTNARKAYEELIKLVNEMSLPNTLYNEEGVKTLTEVGTGRLILNPACKASFDVNVVASLFNSSQIASANYFSGIDIVQFQGDDKADIIGVYLDSEALRWGLRIYEMGSIYNPANLYINYFLHFWVKIALVKTRQAVLLVDSTYAPAE